MARPAQYTAQGVLDAAAELAAHGGPTSATIAAIATKLGAPTGSIYHRFRSRDVLLAELWLQTVASFQTGFQAALTGPEPVTAGLLAALHTPRWVQAHPIPARVLLLHHREDFLTTTADWPPEVSRRAHELNASAQATFDSFTERLLGSTSTANKQRARYAVIELPVAAVITHIRADRPPPTIVEELITDAYHGVINPYTTPPKR
jgi:AcrR family transcriptional regulator